MPCTCGRKIASAGNRTRVTSMATMYSATRPLMRMIEAAAQKHKCLSHDNAIPFRSPMRIVRAACCVCLQHSHGEMATFRRGVLRTRGVLAMQRRNANTETVPACNRNCWSKPSRQTLQHLPRVKNTGKQPYRNLKIAIRGAESRFSPDGFRAGSAEPNALPPCGAPALQVTSVACASRSALGSNAFAATTVDKANLDMSQRSGAVVSVLGS